MTYKEWALISLFIGVFSFSLFWRIPSNFLRSKRANQQKIKYYEALIEINVSGAVIFPGVYKVAPGCTLKEIVSKAKLKKSVDKQQLELSKKVFYSCSVEIPENKTCIANFCKK